MGFQTGVGRASYSQARDDLPRGSFLSGLVKGVGHFVGGVAAGVVKGVGAFVKTGSPVSAITSGISGVYGYDVAHGVLPGNSTSPPLAPMTLSPYGGGGMPTPTVAMPGGLNPWTGQPVPVTGTAMVPYAKHGGTHLNKSWTYSRKTGQLAAPGTKMVRNRRMNWANGRALGRAERRIHSAVNHMSRYIKWVHPKKDGHAAPKFGRKRK